MKRKAFTLIELLVVIAIIAILAAILFPVFSQAREKARQATCLSYKKNIGTAWSMYAQDYDERLPLFVVFNVPGGGWGTHVILQPYCRNRQIFSCPTAGKGKFFGLLRQHRLPGRLCSDGSSLRQHPKQSIPTQRRIGSVLLAIGKPW
jgi:prepilin-type N-terminal cleavage/methylation domain-containing protein